MLLNPRGAVSSKADIRIRRGIVLPWWECGMALCHTKRWHSLWRLRAFNGKSPHLPSLSKAKLCSEIRYEEMGGFLAASPGYDIIWTIRILLSVLGDDKIPFKYQRATTAPRSSNNIQYLIHLEDWIVIQYCRSFKSWTPRSSLSRWLTYSFIEVESLHSVNRIFS